MHHGGHGDAGALIFLTIFLLAVGGGCLFLGLNSRRKSNAWAAAARTWPVATGVVIAAHVGSARTLGTSFLTGQIQDRGRNYYAPVVVYRYNVGTTQYENNRLRFGWLTFQSRGAAERILAAYPVGRQLPVRFEPVNPANSVLELEAANRNAMVWIVSGVVLMIIGLLMLVLSAMA